MQTKPRNTVRHTHNELRSMLAILKTLPAMPAVETLTTLQASLPPERRQPIVNASRAESALNTIRNGEHTRVIAPWGGTTSVPVVVAAPVVTPAAEIKTEGDYRLPAGSAMLALLPKGIHIVEIY